MSDQFVDVTSQGYFSRLGGSILGAFIGLLLVPVAVVLLYWNEGRAVAAADALDRGARQVVEIRAETPDPTANGRLVHISGQMAAGNPAKDPLFAVGGGNLVRLKRTVQMYQWQEETHSESHESVGGTKTTETTYSYHQAWADHAINSASFRHPEGHQNPAMPVHGGTFDAKDVTIGAYRLSAAVLGQLDAFEPVAPDPQAAPPVGYQRVGDELFKGASVDMPAIGDVKVSFAGIAAEPVSVAAGLSGDTLATFHDAATGYQIVLAEPGMASAEAMFQAKKKEEGNLTSILRGAGTVLMLVGFMLFGRPVAMVLNFLPFLGGIADAGIFLLAFTLTLPVALTTIALAWIAHRPLTGFGLLAAAAACFVAFRAMHRRPATAPAM